MIPRVLLQIHSHSSQRCSLQKIHPTEQSGLALPRPMGATAMVVMTPGQPGEDGGDTQMIREPICQVKRSDAQLLGI